MTVHVRLADRADVPDILAISNHYAATTPANFAIEPEPLADWLASYDTTSERCPWLVAVDDDGAVLGFAKASPWKGRCAYANSVEVTVYIRADRHGQGIGRALYAILLPTLREQGYHTALAGITLPNPASVRLHESFGMTRVGTFERIGWKFGRWHDVAYWQVQLHDEGAPEPVQRVREVWGGG